MAQHYDDPKARSRMSYGMCPECGEPPSWHDGAGGPDGCSLTDNGVADRLHTYRQEEAERQAALAAEEEGADGD